MSEKEIIMYSAELCSDCQKMKNFLEQNGISFELRDIKRNPEYEKELVEAVGFAGVPHFKVDGEWKIGYVRYQGYSDEFAKELFPACRWTLMRKNNQ